jgi:signal transduction histidine kinase
MQPVSDITDAHQLLLNHMESGVATFRAVAAGRDFHFTDLNAAGARIARLRREEVIGRSVLKVFPGICKIGFLDLLRRVWRSGQTEELAPVYYRDGRIEGWRKIFAYRQADDTVVAIYDDVSGLKTYQRAMSDLLQGISTHTSEEFFRSLVRQLATILGADMALIGAQAEEDPGCIRTIAVFADGHLRENFSYPLFGTPCAEALVNPAAVFSWLASEQKLFSDNPLLTEMGVEGYAGTCLRSANGDPLGLMALLFRRPIPDPPMAEAVLQFFAARAGTEMERCQMEERLRRKEAKSREEHLRLLQMLEGVTEAICLINADYTISWANQAHQALFGAKASMVQSCCFSRFNRTTPCEDCPLQKCLASGQRQELLKDMDGKILGIKMFPLERLAGATESVLVFSSDITEKLQQRTEAERQGRLIALGELAAGVAHEINNPNALVLLNAPLLRDIWQAVTPLLDQHAAGGDFPLGKLPYSRLRGEIPKLFAQIEHSAERVRSIVEELKNFVSPGERVEATIDLEAVVRTAADQVQSMHQGQTFSILTEPIPPVRGSTARLEQVFINLLTNALQALELPEQGVRINIHHLPEEGVNVVEVVDQGMGMAPEVLQRITDPFFTTRRNTGGLGLGLSVSARIVRDHGGRLHFASTLGLGTTVQVVLPAWTGD